MKGQERLGGLDLARVLGIVAIVAGHVWTAGTARRVEYAWHVPIFFVLTGILWRDGRTVAAELQRGARRLLIPYAVWLVLMTAVFRGPPALRGDLHLGTLATIFLGGSHLGRPFSAFWFVTTLFTTAVLMRLLTRVRVAAWGLGLAGVAATYWLGHLIIDTPWGVGLAPACLFFVLSGVNLWPLYQRLPLRPLISVLALGTSVALLVARVVEPLDLKQADFGTPVLSGIVAVLMSFAIVDLSGSVATRLPRVGSVATWLARPGIMVIFTHGIVLQMLRTPSAGRGLDFAVALIIPWAAALIVQYGVPTLRPWLLGEARVILHGG